MKSINNNDEFDSLVDKIEQLRNRKEELTREQAQYHRNAKCITKFKEAIEAGKGEALAYIERIKPKEAYLIHESHKIGLHADVEKLLPPHVHLAYDNLQVEF